MNATTLRLLAASFCTALLFACGGGGGGSDSPGDQTPPTLTAQGATRAVVRRGDTTPLPAAFAVTLGGNAGAGSVAWKDEAGASRGSGNSLPLNTAANALAAGEHTLTASVTNPDNGLSAERSFSLLVLADGAESDDDNDGLTYSQEKAAGTEPGNGDTDGDGLADGAEAGLQTDPTKADSDGNGVADGVQLGNLNGAGGASLPPRSLLANEAGKSAGVRIDADELSVTFGPELNAACENKTTPFNDPIYAGPPSGSATDASERCRKRAVRANVGVRPGEFRYFETRRFGGLGDDSLQNIGQGIITSSAQIDPYCCYIDPDDGDYNTYTTGSPRTPTAANITPPSMTVNSIGGVFVRLIQVDTPFPSSTLSLAQTQYYGFAVDYRGVNPVVYVVANNSSGAMIVSNMLNPGTFGNAPAMPMLHGHPVSGAGPHAAINLGYQKFHYSLADVRAAINARNGNSNAAAMAGGVGIHRW
jgi:Bacterial TSP3 repeat